MPLGREVGLGQSDIELYGDPVPPPPKRGQSPPLPRIFGPCLLWRNGWIKMALGVEVGLGLGHIVLDGDPAPLPKKGAHPPIFGPCLLWPKGWMDQDATWYEGRSRRKHSVLHGVPAPLPPRKGLPQERGHSPAPNFRPISIVAKQLTISATAKHL